MRWQNHSKNITSTHTHTLTNRRIFRVQFTEAERQSRGVIGWWRKRIEKKSLNYASKKGKNKNMVGGRDARDWKEYFVPFFGGGGCILYTLSVYRKMRDKLFRIENEGQRTSHTRIESERFLLLYEHDFPTPPSLVAVCVSCVRKGKKNMSINTPKSFLFPAHDR